MKKYLNREETNDILLLLDMGGRIRDMAEGWQKRGNLPAKEAGKLKAAATHIEKVGELILSCLPMDMLIKIRRSALRYQMVLVEKPKSKLAEELRRIQDREEKVDCNVDALEGLAEMALLSCCAPCMRKTPEEKLSCPGRDIFFGLGIPMCDENAPEGVCPWDCGNGGAESGENV